ncbi:MAG: universal stress protein [Nitrospirales bacterium]|nr:universal stress protein [Nitrospirales bacterium]
MNVLVTIDNSPESKTAISLLQSMELPANSSLFLLHVIEPKRWAEGIEGKSMIHLRSILSSAKSKEVDKAWQFINKAAEGLRKPKLNVTPLLQDGIPGSEILAAIDKYQIDLVVLGTRGRTGLKRFLLGSVSEWVLTEAPCSVLIVRKRAGSSIKKSKSLDILIGTDGSSDGNAAIEFVRHLHFPSSSHVTVCHVLEQQDALKKEVSARLGVTGPSNLKQLDAEVRQIREQEGNALLNAGVGRLKRRGLIVEKRLAHGHPADHMLTMTQKKKFDLLVVGSRGITGLRRFFLGSVSHKLAQHAPCSVLVVRQPQERKRVKGKN